MAPRFMEAHRELVVKTLLAEITSYSELTFLVEDHSPSIHTIRKCIMERCTEHNFTNTLGNHHPHHYNILATRHQWTDADRRHVVGRWLTHLLHLPAGEHAEVINDH